MFDDITPLIRDLAPDFRGRLAANEPLAPLTWFRVGGPAQVLCAPEDEADLAYLLSRLPADLPVMPIGVGSNLIVRDGGVPGIVIRLRPRGFGEVSGKLGIGHRGIAPLHFSGRSLPMMYSAASSTDIAPVSILISGASGAS